MLANGQERILRDYSSAHRQLFLLRRRSAWALRLGMFLGSALGMAGSATAASLSPDREIASVGDQITIQMQDQVPIFSLGTLVFAYVIPKTVVYVPNSVTIDGAATSDGGRVAVNADSVRVSIPLPLVGTHSVTLRVRVTGSIGQAVVHRGTTRLGSGATVGLRGHATWIEDENASVYVPVLAGDTDISQIDPGFNYGGASSIVARTGANERRPLLQFNFGVMPVPTSGVNVQAAYLELWPTTSAGSSITVSAHRLRAAWTEGTQSGAACTNGATWSTRNCINAWTAGGDYEPVPIGSAVVDANTKFVALDVTSTVRSWIESTKPNQGLILTATSLGSLRSLSFPSREGASGPVPAARLVVILAPSDAYTSPAFNRCNAEIVPNEVLQGTLGQRFTYSFDANFSGSSTGAQRFAITMPTGFTFVALDSVRLEGATLVRNTDAVLSSGEFENWGSASAIDVRFMPILLGGRRRLDAVFRAHCPGVADPVGREFLSVVDHDRRGFPAQSTSRGDANDSSNDADSWTVVTKPGSVLAVQVMPADTTVAAGFSISYRAFATYSDLSVVEVTSAAAWTVQPPTLGTFGPEAGRLVTATAGSGTVRASFDGVTSGAASLRVNPPTVVAVEVTPPGANIAAGHFADFEAEALYSNNLRLRVTNVATWSLGDSTIATVAAPGRIRGIAAGTTSVHATYDGRTGDAVLDVTPAQLIEIAVTPPDTTIVLGHSLQLRATGTYSDSSQADVTGIAVWASLPVGVLDIDAGGFATSLAVGSAQVSAAVGSITSAGARVNVTAPAVESIVVAPLDTTVVLGHSVAYRATAHYSDGDQRDVTGSATWTTTPAGIATIDGSGLAQTVAPGGTSVHATLDSITSPSAALTVSPAVVVGLDGAPDVATVPLGAPHSVQSVATYSNGATVDVTASATWSSLDPAVADFSSPGSVQTFTTGAARFVHTFAGVQGDTLRLTVTTAVLDSVVLDRAVLPMPPGTSQALYATAHFSDGSTQDVTGQAQWASTNPAVATVAGGLVSAVATGETSITATVLGVLSSPCAVTVDPGVVTSIDVAPADTTVAIGIDVAYTARGHVGSDLYDLTTAVSWTSSDTTIAVIATTGLATARASGSAVVRADYASITGQTNLHVSPATLTRIDVLPATTTVRVGTTKNMSARAVYTDGTTDDVTAQATFASGAPTLVHAEPNGLVRALALGTAGITATWSTLTSAPAQVTALPAVEVEALATGNEIVSPSATRQPVLALRFINRYLDTRRVTAFRIAIGGPVATLALFKDDGDGVFEAGSDLQVAAGAPSGGFWSPSGLAIDFAVGTPKTLFVTADIATASASHGDIADAVLADVGDIFWQQATAVVGSFPLASPGELRVRDFTVTQVGFQAGPDSVWSAGSIGAVAFEALWPADGSRADVLDHVELVQQGTARPELELARVRLQADQFGWQDVASFVAVGVDRWIATGIGLVVPAGGIRTRVVADVDLGAAADRTVQFALPLQGARYASGRVGPVDFAFAEASAHRIDAPPILVVTGREVSPGGTIARDAAPVTVFGLSLTARGVDTDSIATLRFDHLSTGPNGPAADPNAQLEAAELWLDVDADGAVTPSDRRLERLVPPSGASIEFGTATPLDLTVHANLAVHVLIALQPDSVVVRDAEQLGIGFAAATTRRGLVVVPQPPLMTAAMPVVDGQSAAGYRVRAIGNTLVTGGTTGVVVFDLVLPSNGFEDDVLERIRVANAGSATTADVTELRLHRDDGDGRYDTGDAAVASFAGIAPRAWEAAGLALPLTGDGGRWFVVADIAPTATPSRTIEAEIALGGIEVMSGNDGPLDFALHAGGSVVITAPDQVLWVAGVAGDHAVPPVAARQPILVLETLNTYSSARTLQSVTVAVRGTAAAFEYDHWELVADINENGLIDATETPLALASVSGDAVRFEGFQYTLQPLVQQRLLVAYSLAAGLARDGSVIDAAIERASDFEYAIEDGSTATTAQFELDSPGQSVVDGLVASQVGNASVVSQSLGGGENNVLVLDLVLPSNGWEPDVLNGLEVALIGDSTVVFGDDIEVLRLWRESENEFESARFDASQDVLIQTLSPASLLRFDGLAVPIPAGGRRFYVSADIAIDPTDGRTFQLRVPAGGIQMASGDDGPLDGDIVGTAAHRTSRSTLLATVTTFPLDPSVGSTVDVAIAVRNRAIDTPVTVVPHSIGLDPLLASTWISGPTPASVDLAPGESDTLHYQFRVDSAGTTRFTVLCGAPDSTVMAETAVGPAFDVHDLASALVLEPRTNLPAVVSRGQVGTTPIIWNLAHADSSALAGSILVHGLQIEIQTATGEPQSAAAVFERLEVRSGGTVRALVDVVPDSTRLTLALSPPIRIDESEAIDLPLTATIAVTAQASAFQLRLAGTQAVAATDVGSGSPVPLESTLPWTTPVTAIRSVATRVDVAATPELPAEIDRGQQSVAVGTLQFSLPGNPGESEARVVRLALALANSGGAPVDPQAVFDRFEVWSGSALLLGLDTPSGTGGTLALPLAIPRAFASGAPEDLRLVADIRATTSAAGFTATVTAPTDLVVQDATSGGAVPCVPVAPASFPFVLGSAVLVDAAQSVDVAATNLLPTSTAAGAALSVAAITIAHGQPQGTADVLLRAMQVRVTDPEGVLLVPRDVLSGVELWQGGALVASAATLPASAAAVALPCTAPVRIAAGGTVDLQLRAQLAAAPAVGSFRFALEGSPFDLVDANDPTQIVIPTGSLPFATTTLRIVASPQAVQLAIPIDPPANLVRGQTAALVSRVRVVHPGQPHESALRVQSLAVHLQSTAGDALQAAQIAAAARLRMVAGGSEVSALVAGDSLWFDLSGWPAFDAGIVVEADLEFDLPADTEVRDFRIAIGARALRAVAGASTLPVQAGAPTVLPYVSPTIHIAVPDLASSFSNYPNPFAAGRESTRIPFYLAAPARVTVEVRTLTGERVVRLLDRVAFESGMHDELAWNGRNGQGEIVRNGTYLLLIDVEGSGGASLRRKLAVVR